MNEFLARLLSASIGVLPLALCVALLTRLFRALEPNAKAWLWWLVSLKLLLDLAVPPLPLTGETWNWEWPAYSVLPWLVAVVFILLREFRNGIRLRRMTDQATPLMATTIGATSRLLGATMGLNIPPRVCESEYVTAPMVLGLMSPTVLLPIGLRDHLSPEELEMTLAHEIAHVQRNDLLLSIVPFFTQALFFFHPVAWLARREWTSERESACDAAALSITAAEPASYSNLLLKIVTLDHRGGLSPALGATADYHSLRKRIQTMKTPTHPRNLPLRLANASAFVLATLLIIPLTVWAQAAKTHSAKTTTLLTNAGFEDGEDFPTGWTKGNLLGDAESMGVKVSIDHKVFHSGKASLRFDRTSQRFNPVLIVNQEIPLDKSKDRIQVGMWVKASRAYKATMAVWFLKNDADGKIEWGSYIGRGTKYADHDWKQYGSVLQIPPSTDKIVISLQMYGPGTVWMDDVEAKYVSSSTPLKPAIDPNE